MTLLRTGVRTLYEYTPSALIDRRSVPDDVERQPGVPGFGPSGLAHLSLPFR